jgi:hypothetical protein
MIKFDWFFHYKNVGHFIMLNKFSSQIFNSYETLCFTKAVSYFSIKNLENFDDFCVSNYFFFMFFFLGGQSIFLNFKSIFNLGVIYYNFLVQCLFIKRCVFFLLNFLLSEMLFSANVEKLVFGKISC